MGHWDSSGNDGAGAETGGPRNWGLGRWLKGELMMRTVSNRNADDLRSMAALRDNQAWFPGIACVSCLPGA